MIKNALEAWFPARWFILRIIFSSGELLRVMTSQRRKVKKCLAPGRYQLGCPVVYVIQKKSISFIWPGAPPVWLPTLPGGHKLGSGLRRPLETMRQTQKHTGLCISRICQYSLHSACSSATTSSCQVIFYAFIFPIIVWRVITSSGNKVVRGRGAWDCCFDCSVSEEHINVN